MRNRKFDVLVEGDEVQVLMWEGQKQVAGMLIPVGPLSWDEANNLAQEIGAAFVEAGGEWGGVLPM